MQFVRKLRKYVKFLSATSLVVGTGWIYYEMSRIRILLNNALDKSVLQSFEPLEGNGQSDDYLIIEPVDQGDVIQKTVNFFKFHFAQRLLNLANSENKYIRTRAIRQLSQLKLDLWHFELLSNLIDTRVAIALARTENANKRLFKEAPNTFSNYSVRMLEEEMKNLLVKLYEKSKHSCIDYFLMNAFMDVHDVARSVDHDSAPVELLKFIQSSQDILPLCLESLLHHTSIENYSKDVIDLNGLPLLMEIYNRYKSNCRVVSTMCQIVANLSYNHNIAKDFFNAGWIGVLAEWINNNDLQIVVPAAKALANLDEDEDSTFKNRLYLLHPINRDPDKINVDVVLIHGLLGGVFYTWRQRNKKNTEVLGFIESFTQSSSCPSCPIPKKRKLSSSDPAIMQFFEFFQDDHKSIKNYELVLDDIPINANSIAEGPFTCSARKCTQNKPIIEDEHEQQECYSYCWPRDWLADDCENLRIIGVNYDSNLSLWASICPTEQVRNLEERSDELIDQLAKAGLGRRPIVWIAHSMGGLMVKNILIKGFHSDNKEMRDICLNTKGIVFYSTPHRGSSVAKLNQASAFIFWPSTEVKELEEYSPKLLEIHDKFLNIAQQLPINVVTFIETKFTLLTPMKFKFLLVEPHSGNPDIGEYYEIPQDHLGICKPCSRHSFLYQKVLHLILNIVNSNTD